MSNAKKDGRSSNNFNNTKNSDKKLTKYRWKCASFPEILPELESHLLAHTSRCGQEKWLKPELVKGTKAYYDKVGPDLWRKDLKMYSEVTPPDKVTPFDRDSWIWGTEMGAVHGNPSHLDPPLLGYQPKGYAKWVTVGERWTPQKKGVPRVVGPREFHQRSNEALVAMSKGEKPPPFVYKEPKWAKTQKLPRRPGSPDSPGGRDKSPSGTLKSPSMAGSARSKKSLGGSSAMSQSLPSFALGPYPPSPAYVRNFMRHLDNEHARTLGVRVPA